MGSATALQWDGGGAGASAIEALGSLFKLTEVYLWDDGSTETREPLSVTKSSKSGKDKAKKKSSSMKDSSGFKEIGNEMPELCIVREADVASHSPFHNDPIPSGSLSSTSMLGQSVSSCYDVAAHAQKSTCDAEEGLSCFSAATSILRFITGILLQKKSGKDKAKEKSSSMKISSGLKEIVNEMPELCKVREGDVASHPPFHDDPIPSGSLCSMSMMGQSVSSCYDVAAHAQKSICDAEEGSRSLSRIDHGAINEPISVEISGLQTTCHSCVTEVVSEETLQLDEPDAQSDSHVRKRKKKITQKKGQRTFSGAADEDLKFLLLEEYSTTIKKYWYQRYLLFSRYDDGVKLDEEGWFSVTPEPIAKHHALRCGSNVIIDGFTGVGGNAIQFAKCAKHVIAVDIDPKKIEYANHNAAIYKVDDRIDFVRGDFFLLAPRLKADTVFLSPPWGGPDYAKVETYDIKTMLKPHDGFLLFKTAKGIASKVVMFLPKNVDVNQLAELSLSSCPPCSLEVERNFLNGRLKALTAYFTNPEISTNNDQ
ncbi:uncharacterized protein LOC116214940 isoform X2 [Punica granatum]|uniref:Trimethylguanosine synthase n=1 Tax=Punica granatum TaxID=22663 RepID=A0A6P8EM86_PUNGR|nr:uncharacterized protein LOC116214940 isoform X2 [Punica granatum]